MKFLRIPHRGLLLGIVLLIVIAGAFAFLLRQTIKTRDAFLETKSAVADADAKARRVDALRTRWNKVKPEAGEIESAFLAKDQLPNFLASIEGTAASAGVQEETSIVEEGDGYILFRLMARGNFPNLFVFVTHLNVLPTLLFVQEVSFTNQSTGITASSPSTQELPGAQVTVRVPLRGLGTGKAKISRPAPASKRTNDLTF